MKTAKLKRIQTIAVVLLVVSGLVNYLDRSTLSFANKAIAADLHLNASQMGLLLGAFALPYALAQLPMGVLLDRLGARITLGFGMLIWSLAQLAGGFVGTLGQFKIARMVLGVGESPQFPAGAKVFSEWFAIKERARPNGIFVASSTIAPALAPTLITWLMVSFGWRSMFIIMGVLGLIATAAWYVLYRDRRDVKLEPGEIDYLNDGRPEQAERNLNFKEWIGLLGDRTTWGLIIGFMGVIYMVFLYLTWLPGYLEHERHVTVVKTGFLVTIPYLAGTLGQISSGFIADWLLSKGVAPVASRKWPVAAGLVFAALFTIPAAFTPSLQMAILYISLAMFFVNLSSGGSWALVAVAAPRRLVSSLGSMMNFGGYFAGAFAPWITGQIVDRTGSFVNGLLIAAAVSLAGALSYALIIKNPIKDRDAGVA
jgi:MFS family permease